MNYFENRVDNVFTVKQKVLKKLSITSDNESKSVKTPIKKDLSKMHSPELFEKKMELALTPNTRGGFFTPRTSIVASKTEEISPLPSRLGFSDFNLDILPVSNKSHFRSISKLKSEIFAKNDNYGFATNRENSHRQLLHNNSPSINMEKLSNHSQEYSLEKTMKLLAEQAKLKRNFTHVLKNGPQPRMFYTRNSTPIRNGS